MANLDIIQISALKKKTLFIYREGLNLLAWNLLSILTWSERYSRQPHCVTFPSAGIMVMCHRCLVLHGLAIKLGSRLNLGPQIKLGSSSLSGQCFTDLAISPAPTLVKMKCHLSAMTDQPGMERKLPPYWLPLSM